MATTKKSPAKAKTTKKTTTKKSPAKKATKTTKATSSKKTTTKKTAVKSTAKSTAKTTAKKTSGKDVFQRLNMWNWVMAGLHALQGVLVIVLSKSDSLFPVTTNYITQDTLASSEGAPVLITAQRHLFDVNLAYLVAAFFFMSAIAHLVIATVYRKNYESDLKVGINKARWFEYGISASTMMVAIGLLSGISDFSTLLMIFGGTLVMNLLGLVMEIHNQTTKKTSWVSYIVGTIAGLGPWAVVGVYFWGSNQYGEGSIPSFVYWIYLSIFLFFMSFAVNMYLQYKAKGRWSDYLFGEKVYMILSLVAKSALAWQVFVGTLRP